VSGWVWVWVVCCSQGISHEFKTKVAEMEASHLTQIQARNAEHAEMKGKWQETLRVANKAQARDPVSNPKSNERRGQVGRFLVKHGTHTTGLFESTRTRETRTGKVGFRPGLSKLPTAFWFTRSSFFQVLRSMCLTRSRRPKPQT